MYSGEAKNVTTYFTGKADGYAQHRPSYPETAIRAVLEGLSKPVEVIDVGCGTGIATRLLARALSRDGGRIRGIEPNADMRAAAAAFASDPDDALIEYHHGTAEAMNVDDASVDLIVAAQAFHWFEADRALREFRRVLRPGGRLALMWNLRDATHPAAAEYDDIMQRAQAAAQTAGRATERSHRPDIASTGLFVDATVALFPHDVMYDRAGLLGRAHSASYYPETGSLRIQFDDELNSLVNRFSDDGDTVVIPHVTEVTLARASTPA
ncbi:MAG: class I SAM-dependent methyltransferase [Phycisphaerales bacterium]